MSFGKSSNKSTQKAQSTSQQTLDPQIMALLQQNYGHAASLDTPYRPYTGEMVAPVNPTESSGISSILGALNSHLGDAALTSALSTTGGVAGYHAPSVTAPTVGADEINAFLNPFTSTAVAGANSALLKTFQENEQADAAKATMAGAFGGSGSAVQNALEHENFMNATGLTDANLMNTGYQASVQAAQQQAAQALAAQEANQNAGISSAGLDLAAANQEGALSAQQVQQLLQKAAAATSAGQVEQQTQQAQDTANLNQFTQGQQWPLILQELMNQSLGLMGNPVLGSSQSTSQGASSGTSTSFNIASLLTPVPGA